MSPRLFAVKMGRELVKENDLGWKQRAPHAALLDSVRLSDECLGRQEQRDGQDETHDDLCEPSLLHHVESMVHDFSRGGRSLDSPTK